MGCYHFLSNKNLEKCLANMTNTGVEDQNAPKCWTVARWYSHLSCIWAPMTSTRNLKRWLRCPLSFGLSSHSDYKTLPGPQRLPWSLIHMRRTRKEPPWCLREWLCRSCRIRYESKRQTKKVQSQPNLYNLTNLPRTIKPIQGQVRGLEQNVLTFLFLIIISFPFFKQESLN